MSQDLSQADPHRLLLVEDEPAVRELLLDVLVDEGYLVDVARDGVEALSALTGNAPAAYCLVLLDLMLPHVDGLAVLAELGGPQSPVPVLAISASMERLRLARTAGACEIIAKPFELNDLLLAVARHCAHYHA